MGRKSPLPLIGSSCVWRHERRPPRLPDRSQCAVPAAPRQMGPLMTADPQPMPPPGPTMRCYPVDGGRRWAAALKSASGRLETLAGLFDTEAAAEAYVARANEALKRRRRP